jgi:hypothetical protein
LGLKALAHVNWRQNLLILKSKDTMNTISEYFDFILCILNPFAGFEDAEWIRLKEQGKTDFIHKMVGVRWIMKGFFEVLRYLVEST